VVRSAGGWLFDQAMAGWDVTVITADHADPRPATILGARARDLDTVLTSAVWGPCLQAVAVQADLYDDDPRVRRLVLGTLDGLPGEVRLWGEGWPSDLDAAGPVGHELSVAARAFKAQALAALPALPPPAAASAPDPGEPTEVFRRAKLRRPSLVPAGETSRRLPRIGRPATRNTRQGPRAERAQALPDLT
jgi:hypothetical protein